MTARAHTSPEALLRERLSLALPASYTAGISYMRSDVASSPSGSPVTGIPGHGMDPLETGGVDGAAGLTRLGGRTVTCPNATTSRKGHLPGRDGTIEKAA